MVQIDIEANSEWQPVRLNERSLKTMCGDILNKQIVAFAELVANAWDAGATEVWITLPTNTPANVVISDNGTGMSFEEFDKCWREIQFERRRKMTKPVVDGRARNVFGRNGLGRFGIFAFNDVATIESVHNGLGHRWEAKRERAAPLVSTRLLHSRETSDNNGTILTISADILDVTAAQLSKRLGSQFLADPNFTVFINKKMVDFFGHSGPTQTIRFRGGEVTLRVIEDADEPGVAWWVSNRLVGDVTRQEYFEARANVVKKLLFVISADCLEEAVSADWSGFQNSPDYIAAQEAVKARINEIIYELKAAAWQERTTRIMPQVNDLAKESGPSLRHRLLELVEHIVKKCGTIRDHDIIALAEFLVKVEKSKSQYSLIHRLTELSSGDMENLDKLLESWQINHMVQVLQLIGDRLKALDELQRLVDDDRTLEVQQLQPAVMSSLWIFGPEYESPEFTSNQTISSVIRRFGGDAEGIGSLKRRPDFVITRDGDAVSFRSRDAYDSKHEASGLAHVLIVELKRPTVKIDSRAAQQCREYVEALYEAGTITATTQVHAISLGRVVASTFQTQEETYRVYDAMTFDDFIRRGEKRLFGLRQKLLDTPMENGTFSDRLESSLGVTGDLF